MKHNKTRLSATEEFQKSMSKTLNLYYKQAISDNIKRSLKNKKSCPLNENCNVNQSKV